MSISERFRCRNQVRLFGVLWRKRCNYPLRIGATSCPACGAPVRVLSSAHFFRKLGIETKQDSA